MDRRPEKTVLQRVNADGQQAREKMLSVASCQGNAKQNHSEVSPHTCQNGNICFILLITRSIQTLTYCFYNLRTHQTFSKKYGSPWRPELHPDTATYYLQFLSVVLCKIGTVTLSSK